MMQRVTPVVKNLLIINIVIYFIQEYTGIGYWFTSTFSMYSITSDNFMPFQVFTYMFLHYGFMHILFNMLGLFFLGPLLEQFWGSKKFLMFYVITGVGAGLIYGGINLYQNMSFKQRVEAYTNNPNPIDFRNIVIDEAGSQFLIEYGDALDAYSKNPDDELAKRNSVEIVQQLYARNLNGGKMAGASGALYGILMAFGMLFPNTQLMLLFPPIPIKAKYLVLILGGFALYNALNSSGDGVAHVAHLGGMIFAFILIKYWQKKSDKFY